jgi:hypothetical protein
MAVFLSPVFGVAGQVFDNNGNPLSGGKIYTYTAGTTTPAATYTSAAGSTLHTNPIVLDSAGRVPSGEIWLTDGIVYKFVVEDANNVLIGTYDNITGINSNFVAFSNEQEIQTATAGQTVFNLTTMQYQPSTNSLSVFVDGVNQYGPGAQYAYVETDTDTVTFVSGLHVGASVKFTTSQLNSSGAGDASQISYTAPFVGSVTTNVEDKLAQTVSVKDFGAVGDSVADDTAAIQAAYASGAGAVYFPTGTYNLDAAIAVPVGVLTYGDGYQKSKIRCRNDLANRVFFTLDSNTEIRDVMIFGATTAVGTGVLFSNGTYTFGGHGKLNKCFFSNFNKGVDINSWFDLTINQTQFRTCTIGINATPPTNGGDNGYINCLYVQDCYFLGNTSYDCYLDPAIRISEVNFTNVIFDPTPATAKVYINQANPCAFINCYFEGGPTVPAISSASSTYRLSNCYLNGTEGIFANNTQQIITIENCRIGSTTDVVNAGNALHFLRVIGTTLPATGNTLPSGNTKYFVNSVINGVSYGVLTTTLQVGSGNTCSAIFGFQKTITSTTINANTTAALVSDELVSGIMVGFKVGTATISNKYYPGLILTVTPATTGNTAYFSVLATNTTGSPITVSAATLNVIIHAMSTFTTI